MRMAELAIERAKRLVENKKDVVLLMDSITRLSRAYNAASGKSGRTMTGGLDVRALENPGRFFLQLATRKRLDPSPLWQPLWSKLGPKWTS